MISENGVTEVYPVDGDGYVADDGSGPDAYYREICHFAHRAVKGEADDHTSLLNIRQTIAIAEAEHRSAANNGAWTTVELLRKRGICHENRRNHQRTG